MLTRHAVSQEVLEPLEHSVLDTALDGQPIEGIPVMEPLEHSVLEMTLDGGPFEEMVDWEPLAPSVLNVALDGRPMEGISDLEPIEHSVLVMALDSGLTEGISHLEPLEHSVLNAALCDRHMEGTPVQEPLEHSVLDMALDSGLTKGDGGPKLGPERILTFSEISHATRNDDLVLGAAVPLLAENVGRVALSAAEVRLGAGDVHTDENITAGLQCWNTEGDVLDQYETFNSMPVYYGGDMTLYDLEDSDWDDPYALASAAYVEDYNFDIPEGMDLMVHRHSRDPDSSDVQQDCQTDVAPVCQTVSYVTRDEWDMFDDDSLAEAADADGPNMDKFYHRVVSSDDEDFVDSDDGSVTDLDRDMSEEEDFVDSDDGSIADLDKDMSGEEDCCDSDVGSVADHQWDTWADACTLAFQGAVGAFPPEAAEIRPLCSGTAYFQGRCMPMPLFRGEGMYLVPMSPVLQVTDKGVAMIPPVTDRHVQRTVSRSVGWGAYSMRLCLLYPVGGGGPPPLLVQRIYKIYEADPWIFRG